MSTPTKAAALINPARLQGWHVSGPAPAGYAARIFTECGTPVADIHRMITGANEQGIARLISKAPEMAELLRELLSFLPGRNDALNYAAGNDGRVGSIHVAVAKAQRLLAEIGGEL